MIKQLFSCEVKLQREKLFSTKMTALSQELWYKEDWFLLMQNTI